VAAHLPSLCAGPERAWVTLGAKIWMSENNRAESEISGSGAGEVRTRYGGGGAGGSVDKRHQRSYMSRNIRK
jgi:hypothetical protein